MYLNNYHYIRSNCNGHCNVNSSALSTNTSLITVPHVENGAQFLNATSVSLAAFTVIFPVTKMNASD